MSCNLIQMFSRVEALLPKGKEPTRAQVRLLSHFDVLGRSGTDATGRSYSSQAVGIVTEAAARFGVAGVASTTNRSVSFSTSTTTDNLSASDFTIEFWAKPNAVSATAQEGGGLLTIYDGASGSPNGFFISMFKDGSISFGRKQQSVRSKAGLAKLGQWQHIAVTKSGTRLTLWLDGYSVLQTDAISLIISKSETTIGWGHVTSAYDHYFDGYIDEVRISKNIVLYTENFAVPTEAFVLPAA